MRKISRTVWILSIVSLFTDMASEMLYPVVPVYLKEIGFSVLLIGILEGVAELVVGLSKGYFGKLSDQKGERIPFIKWGYFLSALSKPMMAIFTYAWWIFVARGMDRLGKGLRTAARDAMLSSEATIASRASIFAFHRSWDTVGAIAGPLFALIFLHFLPGHYTRLFYIALLPGLFSVALIFLLRERKQPVSTIRSGHFFSFFSYWNIADSAYRKLITGLIIFAIGNSSDVFLLLRIKSVTGSDTISIGAYIFYNLVYALSSYPMGLLADRWGLKKTYLLGLLMFIITYSGFGLLHSTVWIFFLFFIYGLFAAATEGIAKAWISNLAHGKNTATAIGLYTSLQSIAAFISSLVAGLVWSQFGAPATFISTAAIAILAYFYLQRQVPAFKPTT